MCYIAVPKIFKHLVHRTFAVIVWIETAKWQENRQGVRNRSRIGWLCMTGVPFPFRSHTDPILEAKSDMSRIGKMYDRCDPAFMRTKIPKSIKNIQILRLIAV
jgi:hypothetical protein